MSVQVGYSHVSAGGATAMSVQVGYSHVSTGGLQLLGW